MFTDPLFRIAFTISLAAHIAVIAPTYLVSDKVEKPETEVVELNYMLINDPAIAIEEEIYSSAKVDENMKDEEEDRISDTTVMDSPSQKEMYLSEEIRETAQKVQEQREKAYLEYFNLIREKIRTRVYSSGSSSEDGIVEVVFTLSRDGCLARVNKAFSNLSRDVRMSVIRALRRAQPFPPFPVELGNAPITFSLTIRFAS
ncbi:MAG: TonB C-terminal domain-containing protein [Candidatus Omnitrophota bacterium]